MVIIRQEARQEARAGRLRRLPLIRQLVSLVSGGGTTSLPRCMLSGVRVRVPDGALSPLPLSP